MDENGLKEGLGNKVIKGLFWKFMERITAQLVTFIVSVVLARLLVPEDYGIITMVTVFITIANVFVVSGFGSALVQKKNTDNIDFSTVFYFNILFSIFIYAIIFIAAPFVADFYNMPLLSPVLRVLSLKLILAGINSVQQAYVSRHMLFFRFFWATLIGTIISAIVGISMAYLGYGVWALVAQYLTNSFIDTLVLWITVKWRPQRVFDSYRLKPLLHFGWKLLVDQLFTSLYNNLKSMVIGKIYTSADLAYYSKGIQLPDLLVTNINSSIGSVLFPALSKLQDDKVALKRGLRKSVRYSSFLLSPALGGLFVVAPTFISLLLTDKWIDCVPYLRIACVYYMFFPITTANLQALLAIGESGLNLKLTIIKRIIGISLIVLFISSGVVYIAISELIVVVLAVFLNSFYISKYLNYSIFEQIKDVLPSYFITMVMAGIVYTSGLIVNVDNELLCLLIQVIIGVISYIILAILFDRTDFDYVYRKIKGLINRNGDSK